MARHRSTLLKLLVTLLGLALALRQIDFAEALHTLAGVRWPGLVAAFLLVNGSLVVRAARWALLLRGLGAPVPFGRLVSLYFSGNFFNVFLPSGFGGDVVRVLEVARDVPGAVAAGTVLVDRLTGLMMLFAIALASLPFRPPAFPAGQALLVAALSLAGLAGGLLLLDGRLPRRLGRWLPGRLSPVGDGPVAQLLLAVQGCGWRAVAGAMAVSLLFNTMLIGWWWSAGHSLGYSVPPGYYALTVPILSVALLAPSLGGLGVREALAPLLFAAAGLSRSEAVALSLLVFTVLRLSGLAGAPVYLAGFLQRRAAEGRP